MNSATSIKTRSGHAGKADSPAVTESAEKDGFRPWHFFVLLSLVGATAAVIMARQPSPEHLVLMSITIGAAGVCAAALYATLVPLVRKESATGATSLSGRSRAVLEREKMLALRSIKELEFDRAMGKISPPDFDEMVERLRTRALSLMKQLDTTEPGYRAIIERELAARLEPEVPPVHACSCGTANDPDAMFCKRCGTRLAPERGDGVEPAEGRPPRDPSTSSGSSRAASRGESERGWGPASTKD
jgi:hypothetical protein